MVERLNTAPANDAPANSDDRSLGRSGEERWDRRCFMSVKGILGNLGIGGDADWLIGE